MWNWTEAVSIFKHIKLNRDEKPTKMGKVLGRYACLASLTLAQSSFPPLCGFEPLHWLAESYPAPDIALLFWGKAQLHDYPAKAGTLPGCVTGRQSLKHRTE